MKNEQTGAQNKERSGKEKMEKKKKKISSRIVVLLLVFMMLFTMMPTMAWADEGTINVYVSVSKYGEITEGKDSAVMAYVPVTVNDMNGNGTFDIDDVLYAAHEQYYEGGAAAGYGSATGDYGLYLTKLWGDESGLFGYQVNRGTENVMGLSHVVTEGAYIDAYINESTYPDNEGHARFDKTSAEIFEGQSLDLLLEYVSEYDDSYNAVYSPCEGATLTVDGAEKDVVTDKNGKATVSFDKAGTYSLSATKTKTVNGQDVTAITAPVCKAIVKPLPDASITVPSDAKLFVGSKPNNKHYVAFTEITAAHKVEIDDNTTTYYFDLTNNSTYNYRISGENYVTYAGTFKKTANYSLNVTQGDLQPQGKTKKTIDRDVKSNNGYNVADIYLNINPQGYMKLGGIGSTYQIVNLRNWEAVDTIVNNYFIEPDYHYEVIDEAGSPSCNVVTIDENGLIEAVGNGTAIVLVTYDAINIEKALGGPFFGAIWPENTGVFVVSVGAEESGINTGMTINEGKNTADSKLSGDAIDAEHDVIYFVGERGEYTFTPVTDGVSVYVANPTVSDKMTFSGFKEVRKNTDGSVTVPLVEGRNIVKLEKNGKAEYQIITAKKVGYTINGGEPVKAGDTISIVFDKIYNPVGKLAGVYNPTTVIMYNTVSGYEDILIGGTGSQYNFASNIAAQTVANIITKTINTQWGAPVVSIKKGNTIIIPEGYEEDTFTISDGALFAYYYGDPAGNHRGITYENGKAPNLTANQRQTYLGALPDIEIPIVATTAELDRISLNTVGVKTKYYEGETFDASNLVVTAIYKDDVTQIATNYSVTPEILSEGTTEVTVSYRGKTATIPVTVNERKVEGLEVTKAPTKTVYTVGEVFNPTGIEITATYEGGVTKDVTENVTYSDTVFNVAGDDVKVTVSYTEKGITKTTTQSVKVNGASSIVPEDNITVSFTLLGDDEHGEPTEATGTHTLKNHNLKTWIPKTNVSVPKGSKVIDVIEKALGTAGIPFTNPGGNYIDTIRGLGEFSNGNLSGWMYTLNGVHPNLGVAEQIVKNGDVIVLHYTDDYTAEQGSESWGTPAVTESQVTTTGTSGSATTTTPTEVTVSSTTATATVKSENAAEAIKQAKENKSAEIVLNVTASDTKGAETVKIQLDTATVKSVVSDTDAVLTVKTENGQVSLDREALTTVVSEAKGTTITLEVIKVINPTEVQKKAAGTNGYVIRLVIKSGDKIISDFNMGKATVTVEIPAKLQDKRVSAIHIAEDGQIEQLSGKTVKIDGKDYYTFETPHFSAFALVDAEELGLEVNDEEANIERIKELVSDMSLKARSSKTSKKNIKVTLTVDKSTEAAIKEIKDMGYTVKYKYYRSMKKASKYQAKITKTTKSYTNTAGKKGTRYYYKARIQVYDKDGKLVAQTLLKQCKYAARTWTK